MTGVGGYDDNHLLSSQWVIVGIKYCQHKDMLWILITCSIVNSHSVKFEARKKTLLCKNAFLCQNNLKAHKRAFCVWIATYGFQHASILRCCLATLLWQIESYNASVNPELSVSLSPFSLMKKQFRVDKHGQENQTNANTLCLFVAISSSGSSEQISHAFGINFDFFAEMQAEDHIIKDHHFNLTIMKSEVRTLKIRIW